MEETRTGLLLFLLLLSVSVAAGIALHPKGDSQEQVASYDPWGGTFAERRRETWREMIEGRFDEAIETPYGRFEGTMAVVVESIPESLGVEKRARPDQVRDVLEVSSVKVARLHNSQSDQSILMLSRTTRA